MSDHSATVHRPTSSAARPTGWRTAILASVAVPALAGVALAQDPGAGQDPFATGADDGALPPVSSLVDPVRPFRLTLGYEWQDDAPLDGGGRVGVQRADLGIGYDLSLESLGRLTFDLEYELSAFDFDRQSRLDQQWSDIHQFAITANLQVELTSDWTVFGGPVLRYAGENGADFNDATSFGGFLGLGWGLGSDLHLGLGVAVLDDIEDDARFIPIVLLDWQLTQSLSVRTEPTSFTDGSTELQVVLEIEPDFELSAGLVLNSRRRFRLDDEGPVLDAVGEEEGRWVYLRGHWTLSENAHAYAHVGIALEPELTVHDARGDLLDETDYDPTFAIGAGLQIRF